jgi:chromosome segregation ATPase
MKEEAQLENKRRGLARTVSAKQTMLDNERKEASVDAEVAGYEKGIAKHIKACVAAASSMTTLVLSMSAMLAEHAPLALARAELTEQARVLQARMSAHSAELETAKKQISSLEEIVKGDKLRAKQLHTEAEKVAILDDARRDAYALLPDDLQELQELIDGTTAEADAILCPNPGVMQEYKARAAEIASLEKEHRDKAKELAGHQGKIDAIKAAWLPRLRELFGKVSEAFAKSFASIGCAGEVRLSEAEDDFAGYAVNIMVKFRANEQLRQLTASYQSGGERSVSTMLYLISLQGLTACPFRVVDEINQGMDPKNERKIFQQMVGAACEAGTPQCFLLTPKLLPQLEYTADITVLCIFNGPWIKDVARGWERGGRENLLAGGNAGGAGVAAC